MIHFRHGCAASQSIEAKILMAAPRKIFVLGSDGSCGRPTSLHLSSLGHDVTIIDNFSRRRIMPNSAFAALRRSYRSNSGSTPGAMSAEKLELHGWLYLVRREYSAANTRTTSRGPIPTPGGTPSSGASPGCNMPSTSASRSTARRVTRRTTPTCRPATARASSAGSASVGTSSSPIEGESQSPATVIPSMRKVGTLIARCHSRSFAAVSPPNIASRLPATVNSAIGPAISPLTMRKPEAPRL